MAGEGLDIFQAALAAMQSYEWLGPVPEAYSDAEPDDWDSRVVRAARQLALDVGADLLKQLVPTSDEDYVPDIDQALWLVFIATAWRLARRLEDMQRRRP
jgi:DhnA family fructose-bisphosphate aldolase class Ia